MIYENWRALQDTAKMLVENGISREYVTDPALRRAMIDQTVAADFERAKQVRDAERASKEP